jgi:hypothetical protein
MAWSDLLLPMFGPMAIWLCISVVFGPFQVWMGVLKIRRRNVPAPTVRECVAKSLGDGNLFIFSIGTAGSVLAVALMEFYRGAGGLFEYRGIATLLIIISLFVIVFAAHEWTDAKSAAHDHTAPPSPSTQHAATGPTDADEIARRDIEWSMRFATLAFICALLTEGLRLIEALHVK